MQQSRMRMAVARGSGNREEEAEEQNRQQMWVWSGNRLDAAADAAGAAFAHLSPQKR